MQLHYAQRKHCRMVSVWRQSNKNNKGVGTIYDNRSQEIMEKKGVCKKKRKRTLLHLLRQVHPADEAVAREVNPEAAPFFAAPAVERAARRNGSSVEPATRHLVEDKLLRRREKKAN